MDIQTKSKELTSQSLDLDLYFKDCFDNSGITDNCAKGANVTSETSPAAPLLTLNVTSAPVQASANLKAYVICRPDEPVVVEIQSYTDPLGTTLNATPEYLQTSTCPLSGQLNITLTTSTNACKEIDPSTVACLLKINVNQSGAHDTEYIWLSESSN